MTLPIKLYFCVVLLAMIQAEHLIMTEKKEQQQHKNTLGHCFTITALSKLKKIKYYLHIKYLCLSDIA